MSGCASVFHADAPVASLAQEVFNCGYVHIGPGLFPVTYVQSIAKHVRRWDGNSTDVFHSGVDGGRINLVPPLRGPFADDKPFRKPARALFELLQQILAPGEVLRCPALSATSAHGPLLTCVFASKISWQCCHLWMLSVMIALPTSNPHIQRPTVGNQPWHRDQLRHFSRERPWVRGSWNHYYVYLMPHDVPAAMGAAIELMPESQPYNRNDLSASDPQAIRSGGRAIGAQAARRFSDSERAFHAPALAAGSVLVHEASLAHRGLENRGVAPRYAVRYDVFALADQRARTLVADPGTFHGKPQSARRTRNYTMGLYRTLQQQAPVELPPKQRKRQWKALQSRIVPFSALTASRIFAQHGAPTLWVGGKPAMLSAVRERLEEATSLLAGHVIFLSEDDADARELYAQLGFWTGASLQLGLQLAGSTYGPQGLQRHAAPRDATPPLVEGSRRTKWRPEEGRGRKGRREDESTGSSAQWTVALTRFSQQLLDGNAPRLWRSGPPPMEPPAAGQVHVVVRSTLHAFVRQRQPGTAVLLLLYSSDMCCSGRTWRCDPCETLSPAIEELADAFNHPSKSGGAATNVVVAKLDVHTNDVPAEMHVSSLPCLKLVIHGGEVHDVPSELYADEQHAVRRLTSFLRFLGPDPFSCPRRSA